MDKTVKPKGTKAPIIIRSPELNKEENAALFPEKMEKAHQILARAGRPAVKRRDSSISVKKK